MDVANELLDAIEIIVDKKVRENTAQIYPGVCKSVSGNSCVMSINGKDNTIQFYGSIPTVGAIYRVFVPDGNMSMAFAITGNDDRKGLHYSNPNLLDNWYFVNPVNQRGQTEYTGNGYTIDRWRTVNASTVHTPTANGIKVSGTATANHSLQTSIENPARYVEKEVTLSALITENNESVDLQIAIYYGAGSVNQTFPTPVNIIIPAGTTGLVSVTGVLPDMGSYVCANPCIRSRSGTKDFTVAAMKLELGSQQTLAHQDADGNWVLNEIPDYGEQLARCQRHFQTFATESLRPTNALDFRPVMRTNPALSTITVGGKTLYTANADL